MTENAVENPLKILVERELSSIEFVRDYYQFRFYGPCLTVINDPVLFINDNKYERNSTEFCNSILQCIGQTVVSVELFANKSMEICFSNHYRIYISLKPEDYVVNEKVIFDDQKGEGWWIW